MKRFNKYVLAALIILAAAILSCKPAIFKGITIKAKPELRLNLGSKDFSFEEFISEKKISEMAGNDPLLKNLFRYKKDANDNELKFMFHYPVTDLNFNMKTNIEDNLKQFKEGLSKTLENKEFTIPEINKTQSYEVDLSPIKEKLNNISEFVKFPSFEQVPIPEVSDTLPEISFDLNLGDKFTTLKFKEGAKFNIAITTTTTDASSNFIVNITNINLLTQEENPPISSWTGTSTAADLDIGGDKTLYNNMKLKLTIQTSGGNPANSGTKLKVTTKITGEIKEATGLNLGTITQNITEQTLPVGGDFQEAEIETGSINITKSPEFSEYGWENIDAAFTIKASQENGLNKTLSLGNNDLKDSKINNGPITIKGSVKFTINNATYKDVGDPKLNLAFTFKIQKFKYIKVKMPDTFNPVYTYEQPIPETLKEWVREIDISALKIDLTMDNQLPTDNNIGVTISSTAFGLSEPAPANQVTFPAGSKNTKTIQKNDFTFKPADVEGGKIDMKTKISFPGGYDQANKILTIKNVTPGKKISMGGELKLTIDWTRATITPKTSNTLTGTFPKEGATDLSKIKEFTKGNMKFKDVNLYIYANSEILKGKTNKIKGKIYAEYTKEGARKYEYILGSNASDDTGLSDIQFREQLPDSFYNRDKTKPYTGKLPEASIKQDISKILNAAPNDLKINYEIKLEEIEITPNDLTNTSNQKMNLDLLLEIPLKINFDKDTDILTITDNDSLSSISQAQGDPVNEVMNAVRNIKMHIEYENRTGLQLAAKVIFKNKGGTNILEKELKMLNGNNNLTLEINAEEAEKLKKQENLLTEFKIMLPKGDYTLTNGSSLKLKAHISSKLDINKEFKIF